MRARIGVTVLAASLAAAGCSIYTPDLLRAQASDDPEPVDAGADGIATDSSVGHDAGADAAHDAGPTDGGINPTASDAHLDGDVVDSGPLVCAAHTAHCSTSPAGACDVHTDTDPGNCGACGHSCLGGACNAGQCAPVALVSGQTGAAYLVTDAAHVYWTNQTAGTVMQANLDGSAMITLATGQTTPFMIASNATTVFWTNTTTPAGAVGSVPIGGGAVVYVATAQDAPRGLALGDTHVYWLNTGTVNGDLDRANFDGSNRERLADPVAGGGGKDMAVFADFVYWANGNDGTIRRAPTIGGTVDSIVVGQIKPQAVAVDATGLYFTNYAVAGGGGNVVQLPAGGGEPSVIAADQPGARRIALDKDFVYWTNELDGTVRKAPIVAPAMGARPVTTVAQAQGAPFGIAVDDKAIYWTNNSGGQVMKVAK